MNTDPVIVTRDVLAGLEAIRNSGVVNMFDYPEVMRLAMEMQYSHTCEWLQKHKGDYAKGIFCGFISDPETPSALN